MAGPTHPVPATARVVIIGGGVMGCGIAYHLAHEGWTDIVLLEKAELTSGSTWHAAGQITHSTSSFALGKCVDYNIGLYNGGLEAETGQSTTWHDCGSFRLAYDEDEMDDEMKMKMKEEKKKRKQLKKLKSLLEDGVITRDEFEAKSAVVGPPDPTIMPVETEEERTLRKEQKKAMKMQEKEEKKAMKMREKEENKLAKEAEKDEKRRCRPRVVRVMPNTPCMVGAAASAACVGDDPADPMLAAADLDGVVRLMRGCGECVVVPERLMDAVTGVSGSGPAYVFQFIEALADGGVAAGLPRADANLLAAQTVMGASKMVLETGSHPGELKDKVCSPGGTTIRGVHELEKGGLRATVMSAVTAAAARSVELGKSSKEKEKKK